MFLIMRFLLVVVFSSREDWLNRFWYGRVFFDLLKEWYNLEVSVK